MCFCPEPTRENDPRRAPTLGPDEVLVYDEPGRCKPQVNGRGETDYHSHHLRLVETRGRAYALLVRHGGGEERISLGYRYTRVAEILAPMESDARYLMLYALYRVHRDAFRAGREGERAVWTDAARTGRIRTRKARGRDEVSVWIEPAAAVARIVAEGGRFQS